MKNILRASALFCTIIMIISVSVSCATKGTAYVFAHFESRCNELEPEVYQKYKERGLELYKEGKIDLSLPYFVPDTSKGLKERPALDIKYIENDPARLEQCCAYYVYIIEYFDTYQQKTGDMTQRQKEIYASAFWSTLYNAITGIQQIESKEEQFFIYDFYRLPCSYLALQGKYDIDELVFQYYYLDCCTFKKSDPDAVKALKAVRTVYDKSSAKAALEAMKQYSCFNAPEITDTNRVLNVLELNNLSYNLP